MNAFDLKKSILNAQDKLELFDAVDVACHGVFHYDESLTYAENANRADAQMKFGIAEILRMAERRERVLCQSE